MSEDDLPSEKVRLALGRLLAWPEIARSSQLTKFLEFIVERKLAGESDSIKAYTIAVDVFGRPSNFDPQTDPIVRVQARRLRSLLEQYYEGPGHDEDVRIQLPTGRYVPEFILAKPPPAPAAELSDMPARLPSQPNRMMLSWMVLLLVTMGLLILAVATSVWGPANREEAAALVDAPSILITELQSLTGSNADVGMIAGLAVELVTDLEQFETLQVLYGDNARGGTARADFVLSGIVRRDGQSLQFGAILSELASKTVVWNKTIDVAASEIGDPELLNRVSGELSRILGSPRGPLHQRARTMLAQRPNIDGAENLYLCRVLFDLYRERATLAAGERAQRCYTALPEASRNTGQAMAAVASLVAEGVPTIGTAALPDEERDELVAQWLARAVEAAPISGFVWEQRARFYESIGNDAASEAAYSSALQLNPANTDMLAARARHLALMGQLDAALQMSSLAVGDMRNVPNWYLAVPVLEALRDGDLSVAAVYARRYAEADPELGPILAVMAGQRQGDEALVASYLPRVLDQPLFRDNGILTQLRKRISDETLIRDIRTTLLAVGVPPTVLNSGF